MATFWNPLQSSLELNCMNVYIYNYILTGSVLINKPEQISTLISCLTCAPPTPFLTTPCTAQPHTCTCTLPEGSRDAWFIAL